MYILIYIIIDINVSPKLGHLLLGLCKLYTFLSPKKTLATSHKVTTPSNYPIIMVPDSCMQHHNSPLKPISLLGEPWLPGTGREAKVLTAEWMQDQRVVPAKLNLQEQY